MVLLFLSEVYAGVMVQTAALSAPASTPTIGLAPPTGPVGTGVLVSGGTFWKNVGSNVSCDIQFNGASVGSCMVQADGSLTATSGFNVPPGQSPGIYPVSVIATSQNSTFLFHGTQTATNNFQVTSSVTSSTTTGASSAITVYSSPEIPDAVYVDSTPISYSQTFHWQVGTTHTLTAYLSSDNAYGQNNYQFQYWEMDGEIYSYDQMISYVADASSHTLSRFSVRKGALAYNGRVTFVCNGRVPPKWVAYNGKVTFVYNGKVPPR